MSAIARRIRLLEGKMVPLPVPVKMKVVLAFRQKTADGSDALTCGDRVIEQWDDETQAAFDERVRLQVGANRLIVIQALTARPAEVAA